MKIKPRKNIDRKNIDRWWSQMLQQPVYPFCDLRGRLLVKDDSRRIKIQWLKRYCNGWDGWLAAVDGRMGG